MIDAGRVLCLNMPAGTNPALSRAIGVMLKQASLQTLLRRPAEMARWPTRTFRPAVFLCDECQSFVTVGENDPAGDEKALVLTRQSRLIPIVATQSISSLRAVLGQSEDMAGAAPDAEDPRLPVARRRCVGADRQRPVRPSPEDESQLQSVGADLASQRVAALRLARRRYRKPQRQQVVH